MEEKKVKLSPTAFLDKAKVFLKEVKIEAKRITWPERKQVLRGAATVIFLSLFIGAYLGFLDMIYNFIISIILR
ncbi:MAG: preprotein translocase subunit SecE [Thermodesulfobacteriaceae bacterium]|jgi:preprotein translocase subunit SecE